MGSIVGGIAGSILGGGKKGSSSSSATTDQQQRVVLPEYLEQTFPDIIQRATDLSLQPYDPYQGQRIQQFSPDQLAAFQGIRDVQGQFAPYVQQGLDYTQQAAEFLTPENIQQFRDPYTDVLQRQALDQFDVQMEGIGDIAAQAGAFGGSRHGVLESEAYGDISQRLGDIEAGSYAQALQAAQNQQRMLGTAGQQLASLAGQGQQLGLRDISALSQIGQQQQALGQAGLDVDYGQFLEQQNFPYSQVEFLSNIALPIASTVRGQDVTGTTTQTQAATGGSVNPLSAALGVGQAIGGSGMFGGGGGTSSPYGGSTGIPTGSTGTYGGGQTYFPGSGSTIDWFKDGGMVPRRYANGGFIEDVLGGVREETMREKEEERTRGESVKDFMATPLPSLPGAPQLGAAAGGSGGGDGGGQIGSTVGGMAGTAIAGPVGGMVGSMLGSLLPFKDGGVVPQRRPEVSESIGYQQGGSIFPQIGTGEATLGDMGLKALQGLYGLPGVEGTLGKTREVLEYNPLEDPEATVADLGVDTLFDVLASPVQLGKTIAEDAPGAVSGAFKGLRDFLTTPVQDIKEDFSESRAQRAREMDLLGAIRREEEQRGGETPESANAKAIVEMIQEGQKGLVPQEAPQRRPEIGIGRTPGIVPEGPQRPQQRPDGMFETQGRFLGQSPDLARLAMASKLLASPGKGFAEALGEGIGAYAGTKSQERAGAAKSDLERLKLANSQRAVDIQEENARIAKEMQEPKLAKLKAETDLLKAKATQAGDPLGSQAATMTQKMISDAPNIYTSSEDVQRLYNENLSKLKAIQGAQGLRGLAAGEDPLGLL
jgi:hypothetical protein